MSFAPSVKMRVRAKLRFAWAPQPYRRRCGATMPKRSLQRRGRLQVQFGSEGNGGTRAGRATWKRGVGHVEGPQEKGQTRLRLSRQTCRCRPMASCLATLASVPLLLGSLVRPLRLLRYSRFAWACEGVLRMGAICRTVAVGFRACQSGAFEDKDRSQVQLGNEVWEYNLGTRSERSLSKCMKVFGGGRDCFVGNTGHGVSWPASSQRRVRRKLSSPLHVVIGYLRLLRRPKPGHGVPWPASSQRRAG